MKQMKIAVFAVTENGIEIAHRIKKGLISDRVDIVASERKPEKSWLADLIKEAFNNYDALIFISAVGIAVRVIAPHIKGKMIDPAVVVVDDAGTFAISLLSGHIGGANDLARNIADAVGAMPVITTATDIAGKPAIDLFMKELGLKTDNPELLRRVSAGILRGESACIFADIRLGRWGDRVRAAYNVRPLRQLEKYAKSYEHVIIVVGDEDVDPGRNALVLRIRRISAGIGCRKDVSLDEVKQAVRAGLASKGLHTYNLKGLASIDIKSEETALHEAAQYFNVGVTLFPAEELDKVTPSISEFVKDKVGAGGVCEPAAILASKGGALILPKMVFGRVTVALAEEE